MKRKGLLCAILALILLFSTQPASAALLTNQRATIITAPCKLPVIRVTVPTSASVYLNPFQIPVRIGDVESDEQIITTPAAIANMSEVPVEVNVTVLGKVASGSDMAMAPAPTGGAGTDKSAFIYFEMLQADTPDADEVQWEPVYNASKHIALRNGETVSQANIVTLPAKTLDGEVAEGGYAPFRLAGDVVKKPTTAWTKRDGVIVTVSFTFTPIPYES